MKWLTSLAVHCKQKCAARRKRNSTGIWVVLALVGAALIFFNVILLPAYYLDPLLDSKQDDSSSEQSRCPPGKYKGNVFAESAVQRMRSSACRTMLDKFLCQIENKEYSSTLIDNNSSYFDSAAIYRYEGCFEDSTAQRLLSGYRYIFRETNNPRMCVQTCLRAGFQFAGVEYGEECFCGNLHTSWNQSTTYAARCQEYACPTASSPTEGSSDQQRQMGFCGGFKAIAIYSTGVKAQGRRKLPKFASVNKSGENRASLQHAPVPRILFLLQLNGRDTRQVARLMKAIYSPRHLYYVHVDASRAYLYEEMKKLEREFHGAGQTNVWVADNRLHTTWGATALLDMFLGVIRAVAARRADVGRSIWAQWDYLLNLSETDMPLLPLEELEHNLRVNLGASFLSSHGYNTAKFIKKQGYAYHFITCERRTHYPQNLRLDGGSDWVVLHRRLAEYGVSNESLPLRLRSFFATAILPLESFFHTLALNSGDFCETILHKNLRFTNWNRRQGCRCEGIKRAVDWCGCSPLVVRGKALQERLGTTEIRQRKLYFFGRKFDPLIDVDSVAWAEQQSIRREEREIPQLQDPELMRNQVRSTPSFNATWLCAYSGKVDATAVGQARQRLLRGWASSIYDRSRERMQLEGAPLTRDLDEIHLFKANSSAEISMILTVTNEQGEISQLLVSHVCKSVVDPEVLVSGAVGEQYAIGDLTYGLDLDQKEEIFRTFPALTMQGRRLPTFLWHWRKVAGAKTSREATNFTSPAVRFRLLDPSGQLALDELVKPYDSIYDAQFYTPRAANLSDEWLAGSLPGEWKAELFDKEVNRIIAKLGFPVFPAPLDDKALFDKLSAACYKCKDICTVTAENTNNRLSPCRSKAWSTHFPDPKSAITRSWIVSTVETNS